MFKGERNVLESLLGTVEQHISAQGVRCSIYLNTGIFFSISLAHFRGLLEILGPNSWVCNGHESHCNHSRGIFWPGLWPGQQRHRPSHRTDRPNTKVKRILSFSWSLSQSEVYLKNDLCNLVSPRFKGTLWMSEEHPLSLVEQVTPIIDIMARTSSHFARLRDFVALKFPPGFPVKIGTCRFDLPRF